VSLARRGACSYAIKLDANYGCSVPAFRQASTHREIQHTLRNTVRHCTASLISLSGPNNQL